MKRLLLSFLAFTTLAIAAPVPIFDGKSLDGWEGDAKLWRVEDGMITGGSLEEKVPRNEFIATKKSYSNFELRLKIKLSGTDGFINSGVQIRSLRVPGSSEMCGYQVDYGDGWYGKIYDESRRDKVVGEAKDLAAVNASIKKSDWNEYRIRAEGARIQSWVNGVPALDYTEANPDIAQDGFIGIQVHGGGKALVQVKDIVIEELPPTPNAPTWEKLGGLDAAKVKAKAKPAAEAPKPNANYNQVASEAKTPEQERALLKVPEGFEVELVAAEDPANGIGKFVPIAFDQRGTLWTTTALEYPVDGNENPAAADALYASKAKDKVLIYDRDPKSPAGYASKPRVFAEGLAIPLGVLPYKNGCYVQHGHDIAFLEDTDADGKADKRTVILTGFGVQDSHLFPHQFMRAPGGWIWMAQGAFNYSKVRSPKQDPQEAVQFDQTRMAKFQPNRSDDFLPRNKRFTITSNGPCNIWGLVLTGEGESFIQEANDFGYPVMPFHEYGNYPGCSDRQWKSYAPEFPGTAPDFRMGGTGLSGLALTDKTGPFTEPWRDVMLVANPITNRIQGIKMHRDGPRWKLDKPVDFLVSEDPWFRPVAITIGPDGCLYIVDWYNKIISHNEVPRNHPDRDKTRGRIWRVKAKASKPFDVPDFTKLSGDQLIVKLGGESVTQSHLAWQAIEDRRETLADSVREKLEAIARDEKQSVARRIQALWALDGISRDEREMSPDLWLLTFRDLLKSQDRNLRREVAKLDEYNTYTCVEEAETLAPLFRDPDPEVRAQVIRTLGTHFDSWCHDASDPADIRRVEPAFRAMLSLELAPLSEPLAPSTQKGKPIKVREAYEREFERYLVRMFLERQPAAVAKILDSGAVNKLSIEARLLATLALQPKESAARVARLLAELKRGPGQEEILRLAQFPGEPGVGEALKSILQAPATRVGTLEALLAVRTQLDAGKLAPFLSDAATALFASNDAASVDLGMKLTSAFKLASAEPALIAIVEKGIKESRDTVAGEPDHRIYIDVSPAALAALKALRDMQSGKVDLFDRITRFGQQPEAREVALVALAASNSPDAPALTIALYKHLDAGQRRMVLNQLSASKPGANAILAAIGAGMIPKTDIDAAALDRMQAVLGEKDPTLAKLLGEMAAFFRPVLALDGSDNAWTQTNLTLEGPCTIEAWVRLDPKDRKISNADGIFGAPNQLDLNFFDGKFRAYVFPPLADVAVSKKPLMPGLWTHVAASRDAAGIWRLYIDGELDATATKPAPGKIENPRIAWTNGNGGVRGALSELRVWKVERTANEIRASFDRSLTAASQNLVFNSASGDWGKLQAGAKVAKTSDLPPILTQDEATALDAKYAKYRTLAQQPGDAAKGKVVAAVCQACHLMGPIGGNIGPNLSGVGAMGAEAILRNILQPNAAMENGYRIYRVELKSGDILDALFVSEDKDAVIVRMPGAADRRIPRAEIRDTKYLRRSLMPEGLLDACTPAQVTDLFAYLMTLK